MSRTSSTEIVRDSRSFVRGSRGFLDGWSCRRLRRSLQTLPSYLESQRSLNRVGSAVKLLDLSEMCDWNRGHNSIAMNIRLTFNVSSRRRDIEHHAEQSYYCRSGPEIGLHKDGSFLQLVRRWNSFSPFNIIHHILAVVEGLHENTQIQDN